MSNNLNEITSNMEFGFTKYIPNDETRNFIALTPGADVLTKRFETRPSAVDIPDSEIHNEIDLAKFTTEITSNPLPALNYRKLAWDGHNPSLIDYDSSQPSTGQSSKRPIRHSNNLNEPKTYSKAEVAELEAFYRGSSATAFRIDPGACHLIDQSAAMAQDRKLRSRLGNSVILLNDPVYADWLRGMVRNEMEAQEELRCLDRCNEEVDRDTRTKRMGKYGVDEIFNAMHLPEICERKPWLMKPNYGRWSMSADTSRKSSSKYSDKFNPQSYPGEGRLILPPINNSPKNSPSLSESQPGDVKLPSLHKDRLSDMENITAIFERAGTILQNPDDYTKYSIKQSNNSGETG